MAFKVHTARKGVVRTITERSPRAAAETAAVKASSGYQVTVLDDAWRVLMICAPGKPYRGGRLAARGFKTAKCRITDPAFKRSVKGR